jgi:hypothetical protein
MISNSACSKPQQMRVMTLFGLLTLVSLSGSCTGFSVAASKTLKPFAVKPVLSHRHDKVSAHDACIGVRCNTRLMSLSNPPTDGTRNDPKETTDSSSSSKKQKTGLRKRLASYFKSSESDDGLTFRQRLAKMGLATVLSYGWISNTNAMILVAAAWYVFCAKVRSWRGYSIGQKYLTCYHAIVASFVSSCWLTSM